MCRNTQDIYLADLRRVDGLQSGRGVGHHVEVGGGRGTHRVRAVLRIHLVVDQPPLLEEGMDPTINGVCMKLGVHKQRPSPNLTNLCLWSTLKLDVLFTIEQDNHRATT